MDLRSMVDPDLVFTDLQGSDPSSLLSALAERLAAGGAIPDAHDLHARLMEREQLGSTAIGHGVAIPHCKLSHIEKVVLAVVRVPEGISFETPDDQPVALFFVVISPQGNPASHLQALAAISKWIKDRGHLEAVRKVRSAQELYDCFRSGNGDGG
jgi:PTS system nitrogen regulatory IIA component